MMNIMTITDIMQENYIKCIIEISCHNAYNTSNTTKGHQTVYLNRLFSMCNGLDIQLWFFSMIKQNICVVTVAYTRDETERIVFP